MPDKGHKLRCIVGVRVLLTLPENCRGMGGVDERFTVLPVTTTIRMVLASC